MAISQTSFDQRIKRINSGQTDTMIARSNRRTLRARLLTVPALTGIFILTGGTAYAFAATQPEMQWVMAFAGEVLPI